MKLVHKNFPGKVSGLISIQIKGDSLVWSYRSGFFVHDACVPINSLVSVEYNNSEFIWQYKTFVADEKGEIQDITESLSAVDLNTNENVLINKIFWQLLESVNPMEFRNRTNDAGDKKNYQDRRDKEASKRKNKKEKSDNQRNRRQTYYESNSRSEENPRSEESDNNATVDYRTTKDSEIRDSLIVLGSSLNPEQRKKLKSTLRLIHHPDHGGNKDFFIALERSMVNLEW